MTDITNINNVPGVPIDPMFRLEGNNIVMTGSGENFFTNLIKYLITNVSSEGLVAPTQTATNITTLQNFQFPNGQYKVAFGTMIYDSVDNTLRVAINDGTGKPVFKTATLT